ncbi:MAG: ATP-binding cassette domain-containing protein, partial [Promethearchaeota archaeon]
MSEIVIKLENLTKKFGDFTAVDNINLEVRRGETIGLVGPNGAGKTTTIKMIAKILRPNAGK